MCCTGFLKTMMFIFNGAIFLAGAVILGVGIWVKVDSSSFFGILDGVDGIPAEVSSLLNISYLLIAAGAVLLVIGFLGCCGAIRESKCMLLTFFIIVLIIFLAEIAGAVVLFVTKDLTKDLIGGLEESIRNNIKEKYGEDQSVTSLWNSTMEGLECCGFTNYTDFDGSPFNMIYSIYPQQCCNVSTSIFPCRSDDARESKIDGCLNKLVEEIEEHALVIAAVALGICAIEIAAMVVSMILYKDIGNKA